MYVKAYDALLIDNLSDAFYMCFKIFTRLDNLFNQLTCYSVIRKPNTIFDTIEFGKAVIKFHTISSDSCALS